MIETKLNALNMFPAVCPVASAVSPSAWYVFLWQKKIQTSGCVQILLKASTSLQYIASITSVAIVNPHCMSCSQLLDFSLIPGNCNTSNISASCSTSVATAAVVSCAVSFITGALVSAVVQNSKCKKFYSLRKAQKQQKPQPAPVYEEIDVENVVYGPMQQ